MSKFNTKTIKTAAVGCSLIAFTLFSYLHASDAEATHTDTFASCNMYQTILNNHTATVAMAVTPPSRFVNFGTISIDPSQSGISLGKAGSIGCQYALPIDSDTKRVCSRVVLYSPFYTPSGSIACPGFQTEF